MVDKYYFSATMYDPQREGRLLILRNKPIHYEDWAQMNASWCPLRLVHRTLYSPRLVQIGHEKSF